MASDLLERRRRGHYATWAAGVCAQIGLLPPVHVASLRPRAYGNRDALHLPFRVRLVRHPL